VHFLHILHYRMIFISFSTTSTKTKLTRLLHFHRSVPNGQDAQVKSLQEEVIQLKEDLKREK